LSPRFFALAQTAFDHNYAQDLHLQQIYGGGVGWTFLKTPRQEADVKATIQYEKQQFISGSSSNQNLIGSTIALAYVLHHKLVTYTQGLAFIPAFNNPHAYSANETNTLAFPAYKNFSFSLGTLDSYLNNPPDSLPPTKRNSFQFTMGLTYAFKSKN
jgi:heme-binding NEAT domain protein